MASQSDSDSDYFVDKSLESNTDKSDNESDDGTDSLITPQPYMFEPEDDSELNGLAEVGNIAQAAESADTDRLADNSWCKCGKCEIIDNVLDCRCCQEIIQMTDKLSEVRSRGHTNIPKCITEHPGFNNVCLDIWVLQAAYLAYRQQYGDRNATEQERYRYTGYRQLVRWCWGYLGKDVRVVLPACAVSTIRNTSDTYRGFAFPRIDL